MNKDTSFIHSDCDVSSNIFNEDIIDKLKVYFKLLNKKKKKIK